jgi:hypothetical protein
MLESRRRWTHTVKVRPKDFFLSLWKVRLSRNSSTTEASMVKIRLGLQRKKAQRFFLPLFFSSLLFLYLAQPL